VRRPIGTRIIVVAAGIALVGLAGFRSGALEADPVVGLPAVVSAKGATVPAAPVIPAEVVAAIQEGRSEDARRALTTLVENAKDADDRAYFGYLRGIAERLAGHRDAARETLRTALQAAPVTRWEAKIRMELAGIELASGNLAVAEQLTRSEAERLLAGDRKDRLAEVYHAFARRLLQPDDPLVRPDPNAAYELLDQARDLAKSPTLRASYLFSMGRASLAAGNFGRAIENFQSYLRDYSTSDDRLTVRLRLGEAQRKSNQFLPARLTWTDLTRGIERLKPAERTPAIEAIRAQALSEIPSTYGIPNPPEDTSLNLGVAALKRFLDAAPAHPQAVRAAFAIAAAYQARGKDTQALDAYTRFLKEEGFKVETDEARRDWATLSMTASFRVGQILQGQQKFAEAIAAWKGYLARFPNGPQSADAQRAILGAQLLIAQDQLGRSHFPEARAAWSEFVTQNPLDARVPEVLFQIGESFEKEKRFDRAIAAWETLTSKFPNSEPAAHAQFQTAAIFETEKGNPAEAIERFKKIAVEPWKSQAGQRVVVMESKHLVVITPRTFRSGEEAHLKITTRNIETLSFTAYKLSAEAYFRKKNVLANVETLDIGLVAPDASWTVPIPGYSRYKPIEKTYDLKKLELPGVHVVKVTDEKTFQATTLVIGSDIDAIVKTSRDQVLVFAQDMKTGQGRAGARVLIADNGQVVLEGTTGQDGILLRNWDPARELNRALSYLILDGPHVAGSHLSVPNQVAQGLSARAYIYTDRPAYRPGQKVSVRGVVREVKNGQYANTPKAVYRFEVADSRGRMIVARPVTLSEFGTFHESLPLDSAAPLGTYRVTVSQPGKSVFSGAFDVQSYQLEPIDLSFDVKQSVVYRGETVKADLVARYQYGAPLASRPIEIGLPDGRTLHGTTDAAGKYHVEFSTEGFAEEQILRLTARLPQDNVAAAVLVRLAVRGFEISLSTPRGVYLDGESFLLQVVTTDAQGNPIGESLSATLIKQVNVDGRTTERDVARKTLTTDAKTGAGSLTFRADDPEGGHYTLRVAGTDRFGTPIVGDKTIFISGKKDETKLRLLTDRQSYKVGEEASVNLHSRGRSGTALITWEADRILSYRLVTLKEGDNAVAWSIDGAQFPNFTLTSTRMWQNECDQAKLDIQVVRDLRVTVKPAKPVVGPGDPVELDIMVVDQLGRPVSAELSIAMVDQSLLRLFADRLPAIGPFFYNQTRTGAFSTEATNTFRYEPGTVGVSEAVVEESERAAAMAANAADRSRVTTFAVQGIPLGVVPAPATSADAEAPAAPPVIVGTQGGEGMMGGIGGGGRTGGTRRALASSNRAAAPEGRDEATKETLQEVDFANVPARAGAGVSTKSIKGSARFQTGLSRSRSRSSALDPNARLSPRERHVETAYWNPAVVTDKDGKARITVKAPNALSEYRITARGVTGSDTLAGQTTSSLTVRKDFSVDLKIPTALTQGDKPRFIAQVHHTGIKGEVSLRLATYAGDRDDVFPRTLDIKGDGIDEVQFEPYEVPEGHSLRLTLTGAVGDLKDELVVEVPIHPWGLPVHASASGTSRESTTVFVGLPAGRTYENPDMLIALSPTIRRMLIELALGRDASVYRLWIHIDALSLNASARVIPPPTNTMADRAAELLAAASVLRYLHEARAGAAPEAQRLTERIQGLVAELVAAQNADGGWPWVAGPPPLAMANQPASTPPSDRLSSAAVVWALASAEPLGLLTDAKVLDQAVTHLNQEFSRVDGGDIETRAALLHALSTRRAASFEAANSLNRLRNNLSSPALAYLALTFANLDRASMAGELLDILKPRAKTETVAPGRTPRLYWDGSGRSPMVRGAAETTALVSLAYARVRPQAAELDRAVDWLQAHRVANGWLPQKAKGPALAALATYYGRAQGAEDRYRLTVTVNERQLAVLDVLGTAEEKVIAVPRAVLKVGQPNRIRFEMEGRGEFGYAATLAGFTREFAPDQDRTGRVAWIDRRVYYPAPPELDGKVLHVGFGVAVNPNTFENLASQVGLGGKAQVAVTAFRNIPWNVPEWERDFLVVQEHLPAGTTLIEGSVNTSASSFELADGVLTLYFPPGVNPGTTTYEVYGYLPGDYRALPASVRSAYEPGRYHLGQPGALRVRSPGEPNTDPYKPTPDELFARGKSHFDAGRFAEAGDALEPLFGGYTLRDDIAKDAARMLLLVSIRAGQPRKIVQYFEVVKEKSPELFLTFDQLMAIGTAYRDIKEYERAMIVWRGLIEASYLEDARVGELLRQRGKTLEGMSYLIDLWRSYPNTASIESDFFGLSQVLTQAASRAFTDPNLRRELAAAGITRSEMLLQTIRMIQVFLAQSPRNPMADEASLALVGAFIELEDFKSVVRLAGRFAKVYPKSTYLDSFQYSEALADFHLGQYDRAVEVAGTIARATYKDAAGAEQPSPNKWQALYILGQIYDARRQPAKALEYYRQVADRFTDAAGAITSFTRKDLKVPEVSVVRSPSRPAVADRPEAGNRDRGVRVASLRGAADAAERVPGPDPAPGIALDYCNIAQVDVKAYPVDLMQLYLTRRNLNGIAGIDLAGITPLVEKTVTLGDGADYGDKAKSIDLPLTKDGAYLVMLRGESLYASGIVLVSPIELEVLEEATSGRVRVTVRDAQTKDLLSKVQVKVIGSGNPQFLSGETDLRGVFVAEGVRGVVTAVARRASNQYAFFRGTSFVGPTPQATFAAPAQQLGEGEAQKPSAAAKADQSLDANLKMQNSTNNLFQIERLRQRFDQPAEKRKGAAAGGFR
jgi:tetratricopeptide (TPR) repeat protein